MYAQIGQTMAAVKSRAVFQKRDFSMTPMADFIAHRSTPSAKGQSNIEQAAIAFYLSNHGFHLIQAAAGDGGTLSPTAAKLAEAHVAYASSMSVRMLHYLVTISAEEARFEQARKSGLFDFVENSVSPEAAKWLRLVIEGQTTGMLGSKAQVGSATLGQCVKALEMCFRFGKWSGGFGGLPWAQIAETAGEAIRGTNSLELMVDKAFTLCHNNGAIFNKGHQFSHYRHGFYTILDIQASGQIPAAIHAKVGVEGMDSKLILDMHKAFAKEFPEEFRAPYDASKVRSMEGVRAKKEAAAQAKAYAFIKSGGGMGSGAPEEQGPPKRPCDDLFSADDLTMLTGGRGMF